MFHTYLESASMILVFVSLGKFIEMSDLYIGLPMLMIFLVLFVIVSSEILLLPYTQIGIFTRLYIAICPIIIIGIAIAVEYRKKKVFYYSNRYPTLRTVLMRSPSAPSFLRNVFMCISNVRDSPS